MNRKQFIESLGATCKNWSWSWSFINEETKIIIFGAWDIHDDGNMSLILSEKWERNAAGRKSKGYPQSREHVRLIEEEGYKLLTFPMVYSEENKDIDGSGPAKIGSFTPKISPKKLIRVGENWYASGKSTSNRIPEEVSSKAIYVEGSVTTIPVNAYERNAKARKACLAHYGYSCTVCGFSFERTYGKLGKSYIHVHHLVPLSDIKKEYTIDPINDLVPICPNCHAMAHRTDPPQTIAELKGQLKILNT
jgi:5-methylcytosine-specific restriction protein A